VDSIPGNINVTPPPHPIRLQDVNYQGGTSRPQKIPQEPLCGEFYLESWLQGC
jgi:hypothetical protein